ncbi:hypothetical protein NX059_007643 [Plenodomus lindquistii]|nr:hypothetical protein NX059_007643 [Plenodomus lindquistii]
MSFKFFDLPRELRDVIYATTWASTTNINLDDIPSVQVTAEFAGNEASYERYLDTAKCLMANKQILAEALEEFYRGARTIFTRMSRIKSAQDSSRLGSIGSLLFPLKARRIDYVPYLMVNDVTRVNTYPGREFLVVHRFRTVDRYFMAALARKLVSRAAVHTFKVKLEITESHHEHHRLPIQDHFAWFEDLIDTGCKFQIEAKVRNLLQRTYPTPHDALLLAMQILQGDTFEGSVLSTKHGYDLEEDCGGGRAEEDRVVYKWVSTFTKA